MCVYNTIEICFHTDQNILLSLFIFTIINYAASKIFAHILSSTHKVSMSWTSRCSLFCFVREWLDSWTGWAVCSDHTAGKGQGSNLFYPMTLYVTRRMSSLCQPWHMEEGHLSSPVNSWCPHSITGAVVEQHSRKAVELSSGNVPVWWASGVMLLLLSHFSRVWLLATPWTAAHQAPPSMGFSRQEHWSGVPLPSPGVMLGLC